MIDHGLFCSWITGYDSMYLIIKAPSWWPPYNVPSSSSQLTWIHVSTVSHPSTYVHVYLKNTLDSPLGTTLVMISILTFSILYIGRCLWSQSVYTILALPYPCRTLSQTNSDTLIPTLVRIHQVVVYIRYASPLYLSHESGFIPCYT